MDFKLGYKIELNDGVTRRLGMINKMLALLPPGFRQAAAAAVATGKIMGRAMAGMRDFAFSLKGLAVGVGASLVLRNMIQQSAAVQDQVNGFAVLLSLNDLVVDKQGKQIQGAERLNAAYALANKHRAHTIELADKTLLSNEEALAAAQQVIGMSKTLGKGTVEQKIDVGARIAELTKMLVPGANSMQQASEMRAMLTGENLRTSQVAAGLGLQSGAGKEALKAAIKQGTVLEFILEKTKDIDKFRERSDKNFTTQASTFESKWKDAFARVGESFTENVTVGLAKANKLFGNATVTGALDRTGAALGRLAARGIAFAERVITDWPRISKAIEPYVTGITKAARWTWDLALKVGGILWPSLVHLAGALFGVDGAGANLWPTLQHAAEVILPAAARFIALLADGLASVIEYANQHPELVKWGVALAIAFKVTPGMTSLLGFLTSPTGLIQSLTQVGWVLKSMPGFLRLVGPAFLSAALPIAAMTAAIWLLITAWDQWKARKDDEAAQEEIADKLAADKVNPKATMLMNAKFHGKQLTGQQEAFIRQAQAARGGTPGSREYLARTNQPHLQVPPPAAKGGKAQVNAPITVAPVEMKGVVDAEKLKAEFQSAQKRQMDDFMRQINQQLNNGFRPSTPGVPIPFINH